MTKYWRDLVEIPDDENACWVWLGTFYPTGYSQWGGKRAHRRIYTELVGPIPDGLQIDHLCANRACVNPAHLEPVTAAENNRRRDERLGLGQYKTHCPKGHPYTPENTGRGGTGGRQCRVCSRANVRRSKAKAAILAGRRPPRPMPDRRLDSFKS